MADGYSVISQKQNVQINPASTGFEDVWEITYKVTAGPSKGTTATLTVPEEDHNATYVAKAILEKIADLDKVAGL
jgi:hypothetical protein